MPENYQNKKVGVGFKCDPDMELIYFNTIKRFSDPQYETYQRRYDDYPGEREYKVLFCASLVEGISIQKEVVCRIKNIEMTDEEVDECFAEQFNPDGVIRIGEWECKRFRVKSTTSLPDVDFVSSLRNGMRLSGNVKASTWDDVERLLQTLVDCSQNI